ncbi:2a2cfdc6-dc6f-48c8-b03d-222b5ed342eb [Sclerotinia trifoliorum]|uniref:2a2cfdc6-dc6f-48c8-b03d-222b5ed342eb n=1 Tax=Sclerotinia trifoliorum TaxID=28548 RepID=A0A8H2W4J2_9HELO|nr:2a2cfdc6-dc6f-48c8-b03d-222b5ed342eb [Sclerotinia trifoliorum]
MSNFFNPQMTQEDLQRQVAQRRAHSRSLSMTQPLQQHQQHQQQHHQQQQQQSSAQINANSMSMNDMMSGGDSLDDIIMQNNNELQRRQSYSQTFAPDHDRRSSMLEYGNMDSSMDGFQFGTPTSGPENPMLRRQSTGELDLSMVYQGMGAGMNMAMPQSQYTNSVQPNMMAMDTNMGYPPFTGDMMPGMMSYASIGMEGMSQDSPMGMYSNHNYSPTVYGNDPMDSVTSEMFIRGPDNMRIRNLDDDNNEAMASSSGIMVQSPNNIGMPQNVDYNSPATSNAPQNILSRTSSTALIPTTFSSLPTSTDIVPASSPRQDATGIYSSTGFDMLGALMRVVSRPNKVINIGAVDLSCAFVVCDLREPDCPIIYVSDVFENLTGYSRHEVLGRNCRFLQSPEGKIQAGERRLDTENDKVYELKKALDTRTETQQAIINYRKGGQPFMNLLTMIPIPASDDDPTLSLVVGFQVDVVANPNSVNEKTTAGNYTMNYKQGTLPRYQWHPPQPHARLPDAGQTISRDDVSSVLASYDNGSDPELTKRMWEKVLLENSDDVIHVLSLKGLFMYLSPSCRQVLEYDSSELIGTALSSICHPSDIVPVTRELKETSQGSPVNVVFRVRRKNSGYTWFESHGSLCVEQGKGRKCIIMVGRERPVYALARNDLNRNEGLGENQLYSKLSTSGMFLYVASNVRSLLDRTPDDLVGTSIQALMRTDSKIAFGRSLEKARTGKIVKYRHEIFNKRGVVLQAETTLYPGDASEGHKPTFLIAQTRANTMVMSPVNKTDIQTPEGTSSNSLTRSQPSPFNEAMTPGASNTIAPVTQPGGCGLPIGSQDEALASEDNIFEELKTTRCTSWQYELRQMEKNNRTLGEELAMLINARKKRKRRKLPGNVQRDCANCHTKSTPEWRRGPSGNRDLCNSCGLRYAKSQGRISSRTSKRSRDDASSKTSNSPIHSSPLQNELSQKTQPLNPNLNINPGNMKDEMNDSRPRKVLKKSHSADSAESVGSIGTGSQGSAGGGGGGGKEIIGHGNIGVGGIINGGVMGSGTAVPASLGGRTTMESQPVHARSLGFNEGGVSGITNIEEGREGSRTSSTSSINSMVKGALRNEQNSVERGEREIMNEQIERYGDDLSF